MRISHFLARCGVASRRKAEEVVSSGRVTVNGDEVRDLGRQVDPEKDKVAVDGKVMRLEKDHLTLALDKPRGIVVSRDDEKGRKNVYDILPGPYLGRAAELVYAGRLDIDSSGLLILTTDGELCQKLTHPSSHVMKTYIVTVDRQLTATEIEELRRGVDLGEARTQNAVVEPIRGEVPRYRVCISEGKNRQIRRMMESVGAKVTRLMRTAIGMLKLDTLELRPGEWRPLGDSEIELMMKKESPAERRRAQQARKGVAKGAVEKTDGAGVVPPAPAPKPARKGAPRPATEESGSLQPAPAPRPPRRHFAPKAPLAAGAEPVVKPMTGDQRSARNTALKTKRDAAMIEKREAAEAAAAKLTRKSFGRPAKPDDDTIEYSGERGGTRNDSGKPKRPAKPDGPRKSHTRKFANKPVVGMPRKSPRRNPRSGG